MTKTMTEYDKMTARDEELSLLIRACSGELTLRDVACATNEFEACWSRLPEPLHYRFSNNYIYGVNRVFFCDGGEDFGYTGIVFLGITDRSGDDLNPDEVLAVYDSRFDELHFSAKLAGEHTDAIKWFALMMNSTTAPALKML